ncbi:urease accessory protein UreD [Pseudarthrobacter sp. MDT3-28]|uniref:urease accessory protein UreD n=1 Tax=Pseudarthrobacter raffinosi TaxID=2953651 RepID=UPI00208E481B|nr:urease accessory protein UreD [Pseudarthrobacter sp. MDT3-28]MCO4239543.1 urease accessory protein UreD [Pseudarthrobacter sp. MDT3-28]
MTGAPAPELPVRRAAVELAGTLALTVGVRGDRCIATSQYHQGALRILRPHYLDDTSQVCYVVVNPGGGYVGGDEYEIDITVETGARLLLTTQSATKVYRTPETRAEQRTHIRLGPNASLESVPDPLIAYRGATYRQATVIEMHGSASLVMAEIVTPGWSPDGALFGYDEIRLRNEISVDGRLAVLDNLLIRPLTGAAPIDGMAFLEDYTHVGSLLVMDARVDAALLNELHELLVPLADGCNLGMSLLDGGLAMRALSHATEPLDAAIRAGIDFLRFRWHGQPRLNLRKY